MPWYACLVNGVNFPGSLLGRDGPIGFCTTRYVQADTAQAAEIAALELLRASEGLRTSMSRRELSGNVTLEEVEEVAFGDVPPNEPGLVWYDMDR